MTKGIREFVVASFAATLPTRKEIGNTAFRKTVMNAAIQEFGISIASAATHYNHALKMARAADPESVKDLGRPEDKKGGRKPIHTVDVIKVKTGEVVASGLSRAAANELIEKAAAAKNKPKLAIKEVEKAAPADAPAEGAPADAATDAAVETPAEAAVEVAA